MPEILVSCAWLQQHQNDASLVILDCRFSLADPQAGEQAYRAGHIPGARYADLERHLSSPVTAQSGRHPLPDPQALIAQLRRWGVSNRSQVIAYDDMGGAMAVRLWWLLRWLGHRAVAVLDGGLPAWHAAGGALSRDVPSPATGDFAGAADDAAWLSTGALVEALATAEVFLLDARAAERYRGEVEPIDPVAGHVPGAYTRPLNHNLQADGRWRAPAALRAEFEALLGGRTPVEVVHMCGSGVTACHNLLAMEHAGLSDSRLYAGSWSEWIRDPARPVATGDVAAG